MAMQPDPLNQVSRILKALTHPATLRIVLLLQQQGPLRVQQLYTQLATNQSATSAWLNKLADLGVVIRQGRHPSIRYGLADPAAIAADIILTLGQKTGPVLPKRRQRRWSEGYTVMTKQDVIRQINQRTGQDPLISRAVLESFFEVVKQQLAAGESIYVRGFGSFVPKSRAAKLARNIGQNTTHPIEAHTVPVFKPGNEFKEQIRAQLSTKIKD